MFKGSVSEWTSNQTRFAYWMQYYDAIYQADDCPDDHIIARNDLVDKWFEAKIKERDAHRRGAVAEKRGMKAKSAFQHDSVTVY